MFRAIISLETCRATKEQASNKLSYTTASCCSFYKNCIMMHGTMKVKFDEFYRIRKISLREYDVTYLLLRAKSVVLVRHQVKATLMISRQYDLCQDSDVVT
jgi:hypothetical protein